MDWFKKNKKAQIRSNTSRKRLNINGTFDQNNMNVIIYEDEAVNANSTIELFKKVESKYPKARTITVICDNAKYYRSKILSEYLKRQK